MKYSEHNGCGFTVLPLCHELKFGCLVLLFGSTFVSIFKQNLNSPANPFPAQSPYFGINECVAPPPYLSSNHRP